MNLHHISKLLSLILRHDPAKIGLHIDHAGWANVDELLEKLSSHGKAVSKSQLDEVVATNNKKRFSYSTCGTQIRANQGHSIQVEVELEECAPPPNLYHGTATKSVEVILAEGIAKRNRNHVHLSKDLETARTVGTRHGKPAILQVDAARMHDDGFRFFLSENKVWLTESVPPCYLNRIEG